MVHRACASSALVLVLIAGCIAPVSSDPSRVLVNPADPTQTLATTPSTVAVCSTICDALIADYGVPANLKDSCIFECAGGFAKVPDACYELVACVANKSLCSGSDISAPCAAKAGDCFAQWSLANGTCRGCWQPSRTVHGKQIVTYLSDGTPASDPRPEDFSNQPIAALLPGGGPTPYRFDGTGNADGTYVIPNVPGCGVWIQIGTKYTWSGNSDVDTSYNFPGRRNVTFAGPGTSYDLQVNNLQPWTQQDWVELFVPQLSNFNGSFAYVAPEVPAGIADGATSFLWNVGAENFALFDPAQKDVGYVAHLPSTTQPDGTQVRTIRRAATLTAFAPQNGVSTPATVNLVDVPVRFNAHVEFKRSTFAALVSDLHPASKLGFGVNPAGTEATTGGYVDIWTHPGRPRLGATAELVYAENPSTPITVDLAPFDVSFGSPYGVDWGVDIAAGILWSVALTDRAGVAFFGVEDISITAPLDRQGNAPMIARVSPPRNVRINGQPATTAQSGGTLTPRIEWDVPALPPDRYEVTVRRLKLGQFGRRGEEIAKLIIPTPPGASEPPLRSFTLPPGILEAGTDYYFSIESWGTKDERNDTAIFVTSEYRP